MSYLGVFINGTIGGDLNDYHEYLIGYSSSNLLNSPGYNGFIEVIPYDYSLVMQRYTVFGTNYVYVRYYYNGSWTSWYLVSAVYEYNSSTNSLYITG